MQRLLKFYPFLLLLAARHPRLPLKGTHDGTVRAHRRRSCSCSCSHTPLILAFLDSTTPSTTTQTIPESTTDSTTTDPCGPNCVPPLFECVNGECIGACEALNDPVEGRYSCGCRKSCNGGQAGGENCSNAGNVNGSPANDRCPPASVNNDAKVCCCSNTPDEDLCEDPVAFPPTSTTAAP